jgi:hypothetical protein
VGEHQQVAFGDPVADLAFPHLGLALVGQQDHHDVAGARGVGHVQHPQAMVLRLGTAGGVGAQPDDDLEARIAEVESVGVPLRAESEDGDRLVAQVGEVGVAVVVDAVSALHGARDFSYGSFGGRLMYHSLYSRQRPSASKRMTQQLS